MGKWDNTTGQWFNLSLTAGDSDLEVCAAFQATLITSTERAIQERFPSDPVMEAASLFDRRAWPADLKFDIEDVKQKLSILNEAFSNTPQNKAESFACFAGRCVQANPLLRSRSGHIRMADCHDYFVHVCGVLASHPVCMPFLHLAAPVMSISVSQSTTERVNSILKLIAGDGRHSLGDCTMQDELVVRLLGPLLEHAGDIIHSAVLKWASVKKRRPARQARRIATEEVSRDSTSSTGLDESDTSSSAATQSSPSGTESSSSGASSGSTCSAASGTYSEDERALQVSPEKVVAPPMENTEDSASTTQVAKPSPDFLQWLSNYRPALKPYMTAFKRDGWETGEALQAMTVEDMAALDMKPGHRAVLKEALKTL